MMGVPRAAAAIIICTTLLITAHSANAGFFNPFKVAGAMAKANMKITKDVMKAAPKIAAANMKMAGEMAKVNVEMTKATMEAAPKVAEVGVKIAEAQMQIAEKMTDAMLHPDRLVLSALNGAKDKLNEAIKATIPDVIPLSEVGMKGNESTGCIIPNPFGGCICSAEADYSVSLDNVTGAHNIQIKNFTNAHMSPSGMNSFHATIESFLTINNLVTSGGAKASVSACHVNKKVKGDASAQVDATLKMTIKAGTTFDMFKQCMKVEIKDVTMDVENFDLSNIHVAVKLMNFPWIKLDPLNDLVSRLEPRIKDSLLGAMQDRFGDQVPSLFYEKEQPKCMSLSSFL